MSRGRPVALVVPLRPVEERFLRTPPTEPQQMATAVVVLDGIGLRHPDGGLNEVAVREHIADWAFADPYLTTRLSPSPLGLTPPAWVSAGSFSEKTVSVWPEACPTSEADGVVAALQHVPIDLRTGAWHVTVLDDPAGPVTLVMRVHHAFVDGSLALRKMQLLFDRGPAPLRSPAAEPAVAGPDGALRLPLAILRRWAAEQPGFIAAVRDWRSKPVAERVRRMLGRHRWALALAVTRRRPVPPNTHVQCAFHRLELPLALVRRRAKEAGGNVNEVLVVATAQALASVPQRDRGTLDSNQRVLVPMSDRTSDDTATANRVRVVPVEVDARQDWAAAVRSVREQLRTSTAPLISVSDCRAHATTMLGLRHEVYFGPSKVEQMALLPSLGPFEDHGVLGLVQRDTIVVSVATRRPETLPALTCYLAIALTGGTHGAIDRGGRT